MMSEMNLPSHWEILAFTDCLKKIRTKKKPSIPKRNYQEYGEFPVIDQGASFVAGWTDSVESVISDNLPVVIFGDHTRVFKYVDFPFALGADGTQLLYPNDEILDSHFFYYALLNLKVPNKGYNRHYRYLREFSVVCPPLSEQRAIAHVLQTIQEAKFTRQREIVLERERKAALMDLLFSHGIKDEPRKQTEIGEIPESWEVVRFEDVCTFTTGKLNSEKAVEDGQYPFFTYSQETFRIDSYSFDQEALLLSGNNARGIFSVKYYKGKFDAYQRTYVITIKNTKQLSYQYFLYDLFLKLELLRKQSIGPTTKYLTASIIRNLGLTLPSLSEQHTISSVLWSCDTKIAALEQEAIYLDELFHAMLEELMTGQRSTVPLIDTEMDL